VPEGRAPPSARPAETGAPAASAASAVAGMAVEAAAGGGASAVPLTTEEPRSKVILKRCFFSRETSILPVVRSTLMGTWLLFFFMK
jgi:hypothetical protein